MLGRSIVPFVVRIVGKIEKRRRFIIAALFLTVLMLVSSFISFNRLLFTLPILAAAAYAAVFFSILDGIDGVEWYMLFIVPVYFTILFNLFYFLLPVRWLTRIPFVVLYGISIYALLLASNIFNVGVLRSIQLFRVAFSVNFLFLTITVFLVFSLTISFKLAFFFDFIAIVLLSFPATVQFLWSINPSTVFDRQLGLYAFLVSFFVAEAGVIFSFMPIRSIIFALFLTTCFYSISGLFHAYIEKRLFKNRIREFVFVLIFVFIITMVSVKW